MKKVFLFLTVALFATLSLGVSSCSDDDDDFGPLTEETIIGMWQTDWYESGIEHGDPRLIRCILEFKADGTYVEKIQDKDYYFNYATATGYNGRWKISDGVLYIGLEGNVLDEEGYLIGNNTFKLVWTASVTGDKKELIFTKIK